MMQRPVFFSSQPTPFLVLFQENKKSCAETKFQHSPFIITEESEKRPGAGELNKRIGDLTNPFAFFAWFAVRHQRSPKILFNREKREKREKLNMRT